MKKTHVLIIKTNTMLLIMLYSFALFSQSLHHQLSTELRQQGYKIESTISAKLCKQSSLEFEYNFCSKNSYKILAFSEHPDVSDIDLILKDNHGNTIKRDKHYYSNATILFNPFRDGEYRLKIINYDCLSDLLGYNCLLIVAVR